MSTSPSNTPVAEPMSGFVGEIGGAHNPDQSIHRTSDSFFTGDFVLAALTRASAILILIMLGALLFVLVRSSWPSIREFGFSFFTTTQWRPNELTVPKHDAAGNVVQQDGEVVMDTLPPVFGAAPMIYGTVVSSMLALLFAIPLSLGAALFLVRIGGWLSPTLVKAGVAGMLISTAVGGLLGSSFVMTIAGAILGLFVAAALVWWAYVTEDPRIGPRIEVELPLLGIAGLCVFLIARLVIGSSIPTSLFLGIAAGISLHLLAPSFVGIVSFLIEFLAAIPSIAYGIWGVLVLAPFLQDSLEPILNSTFKGSRILSFLGTDNNPNGHDMLCAGMILGIMILPIITAISRDVLRAVPQIQIEGTQALGATWWQSSWAMLRYGRSGLFGAVMLGLARAAGETMAVAMVIGNDKRISRSILEPAQTMSGLLANEFREADGMQLAALTEIGLILLIMSLSFNIVARYLVVGAKTKTAA